MPTTRSRVGVTLLVCAAATVVAWTHVAAGQQRPPQKRPAPPVGPSTTEWPTYGHDPGGMRYSPLTQITPANVAQLQPAWVYHMKPPAARGAVPTAAPTAPRPQGRGGRGGSVRAGSRPARRHRSSSTASCTCRRRTAASSRSTRPPGRRSGSSRCRRAVRRRAASSTSPATPRRRRRSSSVRATASSIRSTP